MITKMLRGVTYLAILVPLKAMAYFIALQGQVTNGDSTVFDVVETDGPTFLQHDTGLLVGTTGVAARAYGSANLASGVLRAYASARQGLNVGVTARAPLTSWSAA